MNLTSTVRVLILGVMIALPSLAWAIDGQTEQALLQADWKTVYERLENDNATAENPAARFVMAQAGIAINENNMSRLLMSHVKSGEAMTAVEKWTESFLSAHQDNAVALYLMADVAAKVGRLEEARTGYTEALAAAGDFGLAFLGGAKVQALMKDGSAALKDYDLAEKAAPLVAEVYQARGFFHLQQANYDLAIADLSRAIDLDDSYAVALYNRGLTWWLISQQHDDFTQAIPKCMRATKDYKRSITFDSTNAQAHYAHGMASEALGMMDDAVAGYSAFLRFADTDQPDSTRILWVKNRLAGLKEDVVPILSPTRNSESE